MKLCGIIFAIVSLIVITEALPSNIYYYTGARSAPYQNGMMYVQYTQPQYRNVAAGAVRAYTGSETLATGTYANPVDCDDEKHVETFAARVNLDEEKDSSTSISEAYLPPDVEEEVIPPQVADKVDEFVEVHHEVDDDVHSVEEQPTVELSNEHEDQPELESESDVSSNRKDRTGGFDHQGDAETHFDGAEHFVPTTTNVAYSDNDVVSIKNEVTTNLPPVVEIPAAPAKPAIAKPNRPKGYPVAPKKKIQVRLEYPSAEDETAVAQDEEEEEVYTHYNRVVPKPVYLPNRGAPKPPVRPSTEVGGTSYAAGQSSNKKKEQSQPNSGANSFFPVYFGGDNGGSAIAIANSYSTGEGGSATSHAIAYGSPSTSQLRHKKVHRSSPARH